VPLIRPVFFVIQMMHLNLLIQMITKVFLFSLKKLQMKTKVELIKRKDAEFQTQTNETLEAKW